MGFSSTYLLHGFSISYYQDHINLRTLLSRTSIFGVDTCDAAKKMIANGIVIGNDDGKELDLEFPGELDLDETPPPLDIPAEDILPPGYLDAVLQTSVS